MINNFENLVARCERKRRRRMIRFSFMVAGGLLFAVAGASLYQIWSDTDKAQTTVQPLITVKEDVNISAVAAKGNESNKTVSALKPITPPSAPETPIAAKPNAAVSLPLSTPPASTPPAPSKNNRLFEVNTQSYENPVDTYRTNPNFDTALAAARDYYAKENYVDAAIWAKKANQLNREAEEAWLLYAKSYYAQGRKSEAISILELYLNYKDSKAASELVRTWKLNSIN